MNIPFVAYRILPVAEYLINHNPYAEIVTWWFCWNLIPFKVGYKELIIILALSLVVCISKQYAILWGKEVSVTNIYFLLKLIDENEVDGFGKYIEIFS